MRLGLARLCLPALALAAVAGLLLDGGPAAGQQQGQPPGGGKGVPVTVATAKRQDVPVWLDGIGTVQAYNTVTIRSRVDGELMKVALHRGPGREGRRPAGADRPAPVPGRARAGEGEEGAGRGAARQRPARPGALHRRSRSAGFAAAPAASTRSGRRSPARGRGPGRRGRDRQRPGPARLHHHHRADHRPHRHAPGRPGQHRPRERPERPRRSSTRSQPISVVFTLPEQDAAGHQRASCAKGQLTVRRDRPRQQAGSSTAAS